LNILISSVYNYCLQLIIQRKSSNLKKSITIFIAHTNIYFYAFITIIVGLIINEISTETNLHNSIKKSQQYSKDHKYKNNTLVHLTGMLSSKGTLSDNEFIFQQKDIVVLKKTVEMYQWDIVYRNNSYDYEKDWSSAFIDTNHTSYHNKKNNRVLGTFYYYPPSIYMDQIKLPTISFHANEYLQFQLNNSVQDIRHKEYIFLGTGTINNPNIGDIRIHYQGYKANQISTIFAIISNNQLNFQGSKKYNSFYSMPLFQIIYKGDIEDVITAYIQNENSFKDLFRMILLALLFIPIFKFTIVIQNILVPEGIESMIKRYSLLFLVILPLSIFITYLFAKIFLFIIDFLV